MNPNMNASRSRGTVVDEPYALDNGRFSCRYRYYDERGRRRSRTAQGNTARQARENAARACQQAIEQVEAALRGERIGPTPTFAEVAAEAMRSTVPARQKAKQVETTRSYLDRWWLPAFGDKPVDEITAADCNAVIARARGAVSDATCNRILCAAAVVFRHAEAAELIDRLPTTRAIRLREGRKIPVIYSAAELLAVLGRLDAGWRLFVELMALAGLRKTEATELRAADVDLDNGHIVVRCGELGTKSGHERIVPVLSSLLLTELERALAAGRSSEPLVTQDDPRKAIARAAKAAGVAKLVGPHRLRHGFASLVHAGGLRQRGASVRAVQAWLGHSTLAVTERYTHLARPSAAGDELFDRLGQFVGRWGL
ncbi:MAG: tyrosine-type recombinase/integrase [Myxococcales bacterium]|nr:tyrosine-type recombinase/integrase [Myxococcales bacterium]MCB9553904.1 tyrosine-type recombinase/integrase [Myxococcales bacterium]